MRCISVNKNHVFLFKTWPCQSIKICFFNSPQSIATRFKTNTTNLNRANETSLGSVSYFYVQRQDRRQFRPFRIWFIQPFNVIIRSFHLFGSRWKNQIDSDPDPGILAGSNFFTQSWWSYLPVSGLVEIELNCKAHKRKSTSGKIW